MVVMKFGHRLKFANLDYIFGVDIWWIIIQALAYVWHLINILNWQFSNLCNVFVLKMMPLLHAIKISSQMLKI